MEKDTSALDSLLNMGYTIDDLEKMKKPHRRRNASSQLVCVCGHGEARHFEGLGRHTCRLAKSKCACKKLDLIFVTSNARIFVRKTVGDGKDHALGLALLEAEKRGITVEWLDGKKACVICGSSEVFPARFTQSGNRVDRFEDEHDSGYNALICAECYKER